MRRLRVWGDGGGHNSVNVHAVAAEGFAQLLSLCASIVVEVPLRPAVVDPEAGRVSTGAGRRIAMANQRNVAPTPSASAITLKNRGCESSIVIRSVATSADGKSGGKLCWAAIAPNAS